MIEDNEIFLEIPRKLSGLFLGMPWEPLVKLKGFLRDNIKPNLTISDFKFYSPISEHLLLLPNGEIIKKDFQILKSTDNEKPLILMDGKILKDATLICAGSVITDEMVQMGKGCIIEPHALIKGPTIVGDNTEIRQGAYIRGNTIIGDNCVIGHTTEIKSSILLDGAKAGHFAYIGDSILGNNVNLGAGTKLANLRFAKGNIMIKINDKIYDTGLKKLGAILGDNTQTGCNTVTNPGVITQNRCLIMPNSSVLPGFYKSRSIIK